MGEKARIIVGDHDIGLFGPDMLKRPPIDTVYMGLGPASCRDGYVGAGICQCLGKVDGAGLDPAQRLLSRGTAVKGAASAIEKKDPHGNGPAWQWRRAREAGACSGRSLSVPRAEAMRKDM